MDREYNIKQQEQHIYNIYIHKAQYKEKPLFFLTLRVILVRRDQKGLVMVDFEYNDDRMLLRR